MRRSLSEPMPASMYSQTTHRTLRCCRQQRRHSTVNGAHYSAAWPDPLRLMCGLGLEEGCQAFDGGGGFGQPGRDEHRPDGFHVATTRRPPRHPR